LNIPLRFPGYIESFNGRLRDELLDGGIFYSLREARIVIQHDQAACLTWILPSPRGRLRYAERLRRPRWRNGHIKLTFHLDHSAGADQPTESAEQKFAACEPLTKTFNSRLLIRNRGPGSRPPWEPP
jgi:integrase-like protein